jgi:hypothetical protein
VVGWLVWVEEAVGSTPWAQGNPACCCVQGETWYILCPQRLLLCGGIGAGEGCGVTCSSAMCCVA